MRSTSAISRGDGRMSNGEILTLLICALSGISIEWLSAKMNDWCKTKYQKTYKEENMVVPIPTEVIPVWYIEKWKKENAEDCSALDYFIKQLIKDWHVEEARMLN